MWKNLLALAAAFGIVAVSSAAMPRDLAMVASVDTVDVTPALDTLFGQQPFTFTARTVDSVGRSRNVPVTWTIRDSSLFKTIKTSGTYNTKIRAFAVGDTGRTYVVASAGAKLDSGLAIVRDTTCLAGTLATIDVRPDSGIIRHRDTVGTVALPRDGCGALMPGGVNITWASTATGDATVSSLDSLVARVIGVDSTGTVYIRGTAPGNIRDSAKFTMRGDPSD